MQGGQEADHVEAGERYQGRTTEQRPAREYDEPDGVEERRHRQDPIGRRGGLAMSICVTFVRHARWLSITPQPGGAAGIRQQGLGVRVDLVSQRVAAVR